MHLGIPLGMRLGGALGNAFGNALGDALGPGRPLALELLQIGVFSIGFAADGRGNLAPHASGRPGTSQH